MAVKNKPASALARLRNQAREEGINYQTCLQLFVQEEFLRRLSRSAYRDNLILRGGMFLYTLTNFDSRPTQDIDFLMKQLSNDLENIKSVMETTSRMKDFYDIYYLAGVFDFEGAVLQKAVTRTMEHRRHKLEKGIFDRLEVFDRNTYLKNQWNAFEPVKETGLPFRTVLDVLITFLQPVADSIMASEGFDRHWNCSAGHWEGSSCNKEDKGTE